MLFHSRRITVRTWIEGVPLQRAQPGSPAYYAAAQRLLEQIHGHALAHNDLAKQQNWLVTRSGKPALIDFQLASIRRRSGPALRLMAREDVRHLLKHKRMYCPRALSPAERHILATPSLPSRLWRRTGKRGYNFVTRRVLGWSDGEGMGETRMAEDSRPRPPGSN